MTEALSKSGQSQVLHERAREALQSTLSEDLDVETAEHFALACWQELCEVFGFQVENVPGARFDDDGQVKVRLVSEEISTPSARGIELHPPVRPADHDRAR